MHSVTWLVVLFGGMLNVTCRNGCDEGDKYSGNLTVTDSGRMCQRWNDTSPHDHGYGLVEYLEDYYFDIDGSVEAAENYCRPIDDVSSWCFTTDPAVRRDYCHSRLCTASLVPDLVCKERASLSQYSGNVSVTDGSRTCQKWSDQTPHAHPFNSSQYFPFDESVEGAANYCRNVGGDDLPWCYTNDTRVRWQYCYEQICEENEPRCGGILTTSSGWMASIDRDADGQYDDDRDCLWTIIAPEGMSIEIKFHMVEFNNPSCKMENFIELYNDIQDTFYCDGKISSARYHSNVLHVRIHTSRLYSGKGVNITFSHVLPERDTTTDTGLTQNTKFVNSSTEIIGNHRVLHCMFLSCLVVSAQLRL